MCWMIADSKLLFDQPSDPRGSPDLSTKAEMLGSFRQQERQLRPVFSRQFRLPAMWKNTAQGVNALSLCFLDPLTYSSFGHPKCFGDVFFQPCSYNCQARRQRPSRQSLGKRESLLISSGIGSFGTLSQR
jgi:hypothetical protein